MPSPAQSARGNDRRRRDGFSQASQQSEPVKRFVAVKLIKAGMDSKQVLARFDAERQALALLDHPNTAKVLDGGLHNGRPYLMMELVKGVPISEYCDYKKPTPQQRLELFVSVCSVCHPIQHAQQKGIIHRDIKPSNVLVAHSHTLSIPPEVKDSVMKPAAVFLVIAWSLGMAGDTFADDPIFSGPQVGEKLSPFTVRGVFDQDAGKEIDFVAQAGGKPIVLIFVHDVNRQSISMTRILSQYTSSRVKDGLATGVVWLDDDATEAETRLKKIRHALTPQAPIGISVDGREGPGSYGLNRSVMLTILVGKEGKVTANYALVQPSLQADLPKILESIVSVVGGAIPKLEELEGMPETMKQAATTQNQNLRPLLAPVIRRDATVEQVDKAAKAVEEHVEKDKAARIEVGRIANTIINAGKLSNYGTARAHEYLEKWAKAYGDVASGKPETKPASGDRK